MKNIALQLIAIITFAVLVVFVLFKKADGINEAPNGFNREIALDKLEQITIFKSHDQLMELVEVNDTAIFYRTVEPGKVFYILYGQDRSQVHSISYSVDSIIGKMQYWIQLHQDRLFFFANNAPYIEVFNLKSHAHELIPLGFKYSSFQIIDTDRILFQIADKAHLNRVFKVYDLTARTAGRESDFTQRLNDGGLVTDGMITYSQAKGKLVYNYFYGNGFLCFDTDLKLHFTGRTIDTFTVFHAKIERVNGVITHASPPTAASLYSAVSDSELFIQSALKADNESMQSFKSNSVVDIYSLQDGAYKSSFYIPHHPEETTNSFQIYGNLLVVLFDREIDIYRLN